MSQESYSLREVADLLGISRRTLQRRLQEGAFPGRYLAHGQEGVEIRVPSDEVRRALDEQARSPSDWNDADPGRGSNRGPAWSRADSLVPYGPAPLEPASHGPGFTSALTQTDLESLRDALLAIVREEREMFMAAVRDALLARDRELAIVRDELEGLRRSMDGVRGSLDAVERRVSAAWRASEVQPWSWAQVLGHPEAGQVDVDLLLRELGELEFMLSAVEEA